jgi:hypothetical protein
MTFTYVGDLSTDLDQMRFHIQDTVSGSGPKPSSGNFTDEEINGVNGIEGSVDRTVAVLLDTLAVVWTQYNDVRIGGRDEKLAAIAEGFAKRAKLWRKEHRILPGLKTAPIIKVDAYSDDVTSDDVNTASEYGELLERILVRD